MVERRLNRPRVGAVGHQRHLLDDIKKADGGDDRTLRVIADPFEDELIGQHRKACGEQGREDQCGKEPQRRMAADKAGDPPGQHRADHEEFAMRDIDHAHHAEDKRQAQRHQRQHRGCAEPLETAKV